MKKKLDLAIEILAIIFVLLVAYTVNKTNYLEFDQLSNSDIFYEYNSAISINNGLNPYTKVLGGSLLSNNKYATLFPLYYLVLMIFAIVTSFSFDDFINLYRVVLFLAQIVAFIFVYLKFRKIDQKLIGFAAASFLILNRWAIHNISDVKQDTIALALLMASLYFIDTKQRLSYFLYGFSLGIKHLGIFFLPIYILPFLDKKLDKKQALWLAGLWLAPLLLPALPFMIDNFKAFSLSLLFSFTRAPSSAGDNYLYGYENLLVLYGATKKTSLFLMLLPRLPLMLFSLLNAVLLFTGRIPRYVYALFSIVLFITFNPVYFDQYLLWVTPFVLYFMYDFYAEKKLKTEIKN